MPAAIAVTALRAAVWRKLRRNWFTLLVEGAHGVDGVGLGGTLVVAVAQHPCETQRHAAGVADRSLHAVEGDLDHLFGTQSTTYPSVGPSASSVKRAVCQSSIASVMPLNVLPSMTKPPVAGSRAPRWMFDSLPVRRPEPHSTASTTRSSVCTGLTLSQPAPRRPAS